MKKNAYDINVIVPVSIFEPAGVIKRSMESLENLKEYERKRDKLNLKIRYILDADAKNAKFSSLKEFAEEKGVILIFRGDTRGRKAGAMNDALRKIFREEEIPDFFAFFDVDSRPGENFIHECVDVFERDIKGDITFVSAPRYVTNEGNFIPRLVSVEYLLLNDIYKVFSERTSFKHFNGLIGLVKKDLFLEEGLFDEGKICEDTDMSERIYLSGKREAFTDKTEVGEQAPITMRDLYGQRVRWMIAPLEGMSSYLYDFFHMKDRKVKMTWFFAMIIPFFIILFLPLFLLYSIRIISSYRGDKEKINWRDLFIKLVALLFYPIFIEICSIVSIFKFVMGKKEWNHIEREEI